MAEFHKLGRRFAAVFSLPVLWTLVLKRGQLKRVHLMVAEIHFLVLTDKSHIYPDCFGKDIGLNGDAPELNPY